LEEKIESTTNYILVSIENIKIPFYGLADKSNKDIPFNFIFLPPRGCGLIFLLRWWMIRLGRRKIILAMILVTIYRNNYNQVLVRNDSKSTWCWLMYPISLVTKTITVLMSFDYVMLKHCQVTATMTKIITPSSLTTLQQCIFELQVWALEVRSGRMGLSNSHFAR